MWTGMDIRPQTSRILHGVTQFDIIDRVPDNAQIVSVEVEFTGRSALYLTPQASGTWSLNLLSSNVDTLWAKSGFGYWHIHNTRVDASIPPALTNADLEVGRPNIFRFDEAQIALVQQRLASTGKLSFRLDGTTTTPFTRQIFNWSGWSPPILRIVYVQRPG
ncbi:MAG: hypothetical protein A2Z04_05135 [Chloroflexi bacterium RBG_16_57_9]|nr:MAG: hypothetical protein A2Z04_05135 [Chloroflexi bacterium RBG_16_57_9]